jgi:glycosyltransferase involved in cell wall biosynthesis
MFYSAGILLAARALGYRLLIHHHSYAYANERAFRARVLTKAAGRRAVHIVFSEDMQRRLSQLYPDAKRFYQMGNAIFVRARDHPATHDANTQALRIGHLSNLSAEKGLPIVLNVVQALLGEGIACELWLAGPSSPDCAPLIADAIATNKLIKYLGPVDEKAKTKFFAHLDVFLFPTRFPLEAEPLVVLEALAHGVPVIAYRRGTIGDLLAGSLGLAVDPTEEFLTRALPLLRAMSTDPKKRSEMSDASFNRFHELHRLALSQSRGLLTVAERTNGRPANGS